MRLSVVVGTNLAAAPRHAMKKAYAVLLLPMVLASVCLAPAPARAEVLPTGGFASSVPIDVPALHGLDPHLALSYLSTTANGIAGPGWTLAGFSTIERVGPHMAVPRYDGSDVLALGGVELVPCGPGVVSPSCAAGGTHASQIESYARIVFDGTSFTVTAKDGTRSVYTPISTAYASTCPDVAIATPYTSELSVDPLTGPFCPNGDDSAITQMQVWSGTLESGGFYWLASGSCGSTSSAARCAPSARQKGAPLGVYRWGLTSVTDMHDNRLTYDWTCDAWPDSACYPAAVSHAGARVDLRYEPRPDPVTSARGGQTLETATRRLATIDASVGGQPTRSYALRYGADGVGRTSLESLLQVGRDVIHDASFHVVDGTNAGVTWFTADPGVTELMAPTTTLSGAAAAVAADPGTHWDWTLVDSNHRFADVNGDGRADLCTWLAYSTGEVACFLSEKVGTGAYDYAFNSAWGRIQWPHLSGGLTVADIDGDGRADLCGYSDYSLDERGLECARSNGVGGFDPPQLWFKTSWIAPVYVRAWTPSVRLGDVDGDGMADLCAGGPSGRITCWRSTGRGFGSALFEIPSSNAFFGFALADVDGDGRTDLCVAKDGVCWRADAPSVSVALPPWATEVANAKRELSYVDVNGDGRVDVCGRLADGAHCSLFTGAGFFVDLPVLTDLSDAAGFSGESFVDVDKDGRTDVCATAAGVPSCFFSTGAGFAANGPSVGLGVTGNAPFPAGTTKDKRPMFTDVTGDGIADACLFTSSGLVCATMQMDNWRAVPGMGWGLLQRIYGTGGSMTQLTYVPSSGMPGSRLPLGMVLPVISRVAIHDGSDQDNVTSSSYEYEGATWSQSERRVLGFRKLTSRETDRVIETFYHQHEGCLVKPETVMLRDVAGTLVDYHHVEYSENSVAPFTSLVRSDWTAQCSGTACSGSVRSYDYDGFANVKEQTDSAASADVAIASGAAVVSTVGVRHQRWDYAPNTSAYVVDRPVHHQVSDDTGPAKFTTFYYDGAESAAEALLPPRRGDPTKVTEWDDVHGHEVATRYHFDAWGNLDRETDPRGFATTTDFDSGLHALPTRTCNVLSHCTDQTWDTALLVPLTVTDPNGVTTSTTYDPIGRPLRKTVVDALGVTVAAPHRIEYYDPNLGQAGPGAPGYVDASTLARTVSIREDGTADGLWTVAYTDGLGRVVGTLTKSGVTSESSYLGVTDLRTSFTEPHEVAKTAQVTWIYYDADRRPSVSLAPDASGKYSSYGPGWSLLRDDLGHETWAFYDHLGRAVRVQELIGSVGGLSAASATRMVTTQMVTPQKVGIEPVARKVYATTSYEYDAMGQRTASTDSSANRSSTVYDMLGRPRTTCAPGVGCTTLDRDDAGNVRTRADGAGTTFYFYDNINRLEREEPPSGVINRYFYDLPPSFGGHIGSLMGVLILPAPGDDGGAAGRGYEYDALGRVTSERLWVSAPPPYFAYGAKTATTVTHRDPLGHVDQIDFPDGGRVVYEYDQLGRIKDIPGFVTAVTYDADRATDITYANGVSEHVDLDPRRGWHASTTVRGPDGAALFQATYLRRTDGTKRSVSSTTDPSMNVNFGYDLLGRLTDVTGAQADHFTYDAVGNMLTRATVGELRHDDPARPYAITSDPAGSYTYDAVGRTKTDPTRSYTWGSGGELLGIDSGAKSLRMRYDDRGQRLRKSDGTNTTYNFGPLYRVDLAATDEQAFFEEDALPPGAGVDSVYVGDRLVAERRSDGSKLFFHADDVGSPRVVTDANGAVVRRFAYDAFGGSLPGAGTTPISVGFAGQTDDVETGLLYMGARYYDPRIGRFVSPDDRATGRSDAHALHRYAYASNDPVNRVDPTGHEDITLPMLPGFTGTGTEFDPQVVVIIGKRDPFIPASGGVADFFAGLGAALIFDAPLDATPPLRQSNEFLFGHDVGQRWAEVLPMLAQVPALKGPISAIILVRKVNRAFPVPPTARASEESAPPAWVSSGKGETQVSSLNLWSRHGKKDQLRLDVENHQRPGEVGQVHLQSKRTHEKWLLDPKSGEWLRYQTKEPAPAWVKDLEQDPAFQRAIDKGMGYLDLKRNPNFKP